MSKLTLAIGAASGNVPSGKSSKNSSQRSASVVAQRSANGASQQIRKASKLPEISGSFDTLEEAEAVFSRSYVQAGAALKAIRDQGLYKKGGYHSFEVYCQERWGWSGDKAYETIAASETVLSLGDGTPRPTNVSQSSALRAAPEDQRDSVMIETVVRTGGGHTAAQITDTIKPPKITDGTSPREQRTDAQIEQNRLNRVDNLSHPPVRGNGVTGYDSEGQGYPEDLPSRDVSEDPAAPPLRTFDVATELLNAIALAGNCLGDADAIDEVVRTCKLSGAGITRSEVAGCAERFIALANAWPLG